MKKFVIPLLIGLLAASIYVMASAAYKTHRLWSDGNELAYTQSWTTTAADTGAGGKVSIHDETYYSDTIDFDTMGDFTLFDYAARLYQIDTGKLAADTANDTIEVSFMTFLPGYETALRVDTIYGIDTVVQLAIPRDSLFRYGYIKCVYNDTFDLTAKVPSTMAYHWWMEVETK